MRPKRKCVAKNQQISDDCNNNKNRPKRRCVVKDQRIFDDHGDKNKKKVVINSLDNDSLAKIFMLLPIPERIEMEKICTKWKEACQLAWYDIKKYKCKSSIGRSYDNRLLTQSYLVKILLKCGNYLKELSLSDICDSSIMSFVGDHCKNLTSLVCKFDDNVLIDNADHFVQAFTQLDKLKCVKILLDHTMKKKAVNLFEIINSLPEEIIEIQILHKYWYGDRAVLFTLKKFKKLQKLILTGFCVDELTLQEIAEATTLVHLNIGLYDKHIEFPLFDKLVNLEYIQMEIERKDNEKKVSTKVVNTIFCKCKNLKHLHIPNDFYDLAEISFEKWENFKNLEYLTLSCYEILPDLADTIVKYCKNLKHLCVNPICDSIELNVVEKLTKLENLESFIIDLQYFELTEESIIAISNNCKHLKRLQLNNCCLVPYIDGDELSSPSVLNELSKIQYLEHLNLYNAENIDDNTIIAIANNCKNLKNLEIPGCSAVTETALIALTKLENLEILRVGFRDISDSFIIKLKGLKEFDCDGCEELTDVGIIQFIKNNPDLENIYANGIDNITIDLVIGADQATKNRTNGIVLHIMINNFSIIEASKSIITSQWLVVTT